jgi:hypothetical protein
MKYAVMTFAVAVLAFGGIFVGFAQEPVGEKSPELITAEKILALFDANKDGKIEGKEAGKVVKKLDKDGDGGLSAKEIEEALKAGGGKKKRGKKAGNEGGKKKKKKEKDADADAPKE